MNIAGEPHEKEACQKRLDNLRDVVRYLCKVQGCTVMADDRGGLGLGCTEDGCDNEAGWYAEEATL
jgi:hypothetical protein